MDLLTLLFTIAFNAAPDCGYEDGSDMPRASVCKWDAGDRGNGEGESFVAVRSTNDTMLYFYEDLSVEVNTDLTPCDFADAPKTCEA